MLRRLLCPLLTVVILTSYLYVHEALWLNRAQVRQSVRAGFVLPSRFNRVLALGNQGLFSNYLFLKTITFFGDRVGSAEKLSDEDWRYVVASLDAVTDLDPYFLDPYIFAEGALTWDAGRFEEANRLLQKGFERRPDQWRLPFYIGFNYFYFLKDYERGAEYLMAASRAPDSPTFLTTLAARLAYYGGQAKTGVLFLKGILAETQDPRLRAILETRMVALEGAAYLESLVERFKEEKGRLPVRLEELLAEGYLAELPVEPYGGEWLLLESGRVFSTSKFVEGARAEEPK